MGICIDCGLKSPWGSKRCSNCLGAFNEKAAKEKQLLIETATPSLWRLVQELEYEDDFFIFEEVAKALPKELNYLGMFSEQVYLTDQGILTFQTTVFKSRLVKQELIPLNTITGFEIAPPKASSTMWEITLTRANNVDTLYSMAEERVIKDFIKKTQAAIASGSAGAAGQNSPAPSDRLASLKQLLDDGLITQEEFDQKRKIIISDI